MVGKGIVCFQYVCRVPSQTGNFFLFQFRFHRFMIFSVSALHFLSVQCLSHTQNSYFKRLASHLFVLSFFLYSLLID